MYFDSDEKKMCKDGSGYFFLYLHFGKYDGWQSNCIDKKIELLIFVLWKFFGDG